MKTFLNINIDQASDNEKTMLESAQSFWDIKDGKLGINWDSLTPDQKEVMESFSLDNLFALSNKDSELKEELL